MTGAALENPPVERSQLKPGLISGAQVSRASRKEMEQILGEKTTQVVDMDEKHRVTRATKWVGALQPTAWIAQVSVWR